MNILNIIDKIYENEHFATIFIIAVIVLILLFILILFIGLRDAKKAKEPPKKKEEEINDITFDTLKETEPIKEDVTFEVPVLTKNLEEFKKNFEDEIKKDQEVEVRTTKSDYLEESTKPVRKLDMGSIDDTAVLPYIVSDIKLKSDDEDENQKEVFSTKKINLLEEIDANKLTFDEDDEF